MCSFIILGLVVNGIFVQILCRLKEGLGAFLWLFCEAFSWFNVTFMIGNDPWGLVLSFG